MEAVISANKFLDLLSCIAPAVATDPTRGAICGVKLEVIAKEYSIRAIGCDGHILSVAQRNLGFSTESQSDIEDIEAQKKITDATWLLSKIDVELLIISLKKLGVKRKETEDETQGRYYIAIRETDLMSLDADHNASSKRVLSISILGLSHVVLEPTLLNDEYPDWKNLIPKESAETNYIGFDLAKLNLLHKCWGGEKVFMSFLAESKITKITRDSEDEHNDKDFIVLMPLRKMAEDQEKINKNQMNLFK